MANPVPSPEAWNFRLSVRLIHDIRAMLDFAVATAPPGRVEAFQGVRNEFLDLIINGEDEDAKRRTV